MKKTFSLLIVISTLLINSSQAQWQQTFGPFGWGCMYMANCNGTIFASGSKLHRSTDNGMTWQDKSNGIAQWEALAIFESAGRVFASFGLNDVPYLYFSDDNGENWTQLNNLNITSPIRGFTKLGSKLFFTSDHFYQNGVYASTDNGMTWTKTPMGGLSNLVSNCILTSGNYLILGTTDGVYRSSDEGNNWQRMANTDVNEVNSITFCNNTMFVAYGSGAYYYTSVYKSNDYGATYTKVGDSNTLPYIRNLFSEGNNVYLNTDNGTYRSADYGSTWTHIAIRGETIYTGVKCGGNLVLGTRENGIFTSTNNGTTWINTGYTSEINIDAIASYNDVLITAANGQQGLKISRNNGDSFTEYVNLSHTAIHCLAVRGTDFFAGTGTSGTLASGLFKSTDLGITWSVLGFPNMEVFSIAFKDNYIFAGTFSDGIYRTSNEGTTWNLINVGLPSSWIKTFVVKDNILYAGTSQGVYASSNNGSNWSLAGLGNKQVNSLTVMDSKLYAATNSGIYVFETSGNGTLLGYEYNEVQFIKSLNTTLFANIGNELLMSKDYGSTWTSIKQGLNSEMVYNLVFNSTYAFAGTYAKSVWRRSINDILTDIKYPRTAIPDNFSLNQNYPNPFNPATIITYSLPYESRIKISICNLLGEVIKEYVQDNVSLGYHELYFEGKNLSSGVYIYSIEVSSLDGKHVYKSSRKMLLMK